MRKIFKILVILLALQCIYSTFNYYNLQYSYINNDLINKYDISQYINIPPPVIDISACLTASNKRDGKSITEVIIHHDSIQYCPYTPIFDINRYHIKKGFGSIAYHYYISKKGKIYKLHNHEDITAHTKWKNTHTLSVCIQGNYSNEFISKLQYKSLIELLSYLSLDVAFHSTYNDTQCPGRNLNLGTIRNDLQKQHLLCKIL